MNPSLQRVVKGIVLFTVVGAWTHVHAGNPLKASIWCDFTLQMDGRTRSEYDDPDALFLCASQGVTSAPTTIAMSVSQYVGAIFESLSPSDKRTVAAARLEASEIAANPDHIEGSGSPTFNRAKGILIQRENGRPSNLRDRHYAELIGHINQAL